MLLLGYLEYQINYLRFKIVGISNAKKALKMTKSGIKNAKKLNFKCQSLLIKWTPVVFNLSELID